MDFYDATKGFSHHINYVSPDIYNYDKVASFLDNMINNGKSCLVYGDYDPDGLFSVLGWKAGLLKLGYKKFKIFKYKNRTHSIDKAFIKEAIRGGFDYVIINDAGTSDMLNLTYLTNNGIKVILLDHHQTKYSYRDYNDNIAMINTTIENKDHGKSFNLSTGGLVFVVLEKYLKSKRKVCLELSHYALASLYADSIDMSAELNRSIYFLARDDRDFVPHEIGAFLNNYQAVCRRFIEFHMIPKINSAFRYESFDIINETYLKETKPTKGECLVLVEFLTELHKTSANMVGTVSDIIYHEVFDNFVIGNLNSVNSHIDIRDNRLQNFTGLIANKLAEKYKKSAVVYCGMSGNVKGSFRDLFGRNYLNIFQNFCKAEGHNAAFGIHLDTYEMPNFIQHLKIVDNKFNIDVVENEPLLVTGYHAPPETNILADLALYNEFAGVKKPLAFINIARRQDMYEKPTGYGGYIYDWNGKTIYSKTRVSVGAVMQVKPTVGKTIRLYAV